MTTPITMATALFLKHFSHNNSTVLITMYIIYPEEIATIYTSLIIMYYTRIWHIFADLIFLVNIFSYNINFRELFKNKK